MRALPRPPSQHVYKATAKSQQAPVGETLHQSSSKIRTQPVHYQAKSCLSHTEPMDTSKHTTGLVTTLQRDKISSINQKTSTNPPNPGNLHIISPIPPKGQTPQWRKNNLLPSRKKTLNAVIKQNEKTEKHPVNKGPW